MSSIFKIKQIRVFTGLIYALYKVLSLKYKVSILKHQKSSQIISIYFHDISERRFEKILFWIKKHKFRIISQAELIDFLYNNIEITGGVWLTFDDGWKNNLNLLPIIERYNVPITIFLTTGTINANGTFWTAIYESQMGHRVGKEFHQLTYEDKIKLIDAYNTNSDKNNVQNALSEEQMKSICNHPLVTVGLHTHNHVSLINCTEEEIERELELNIKAIRKFYSKDLQSFAYPHGLADSTHEILFRKSDIKIAAVTGNKIIKRTTNPFLLPRYGYSEASLLENYCKFMDCWNRG